MRRMTTREMTAAAATALLLAAGAGTAQAVAAEPADRPAATTGPAVGPPTAHTTWTGQVLAAVTARRAPRPSARPVMVLQPIAPLGGGLTVVQIEARTTGGDGRDWVRVRLPVRPNGTQGWIPMDVLRLSSTAMRIRIDLSERRLTLFRAGRVVRHVRVAIGKPGTPTPRGRFAVAEMIRTRTPGAFIGPVVFPLTGFSETLNEYAGGNGRVAMHGTSVPHLLGTRASHGCIRMSNRDVVALARIVRPGTPVQIVP